VLDIVSSAEYGLLLSNAMFAIRAPFCCTQTKIAKCVKRMRMMARPINPNKPYSKLEKDYIARVAGKVPLQVIASAINRPPSGVQQWANAHGIKLRVPYSIMVKHWREYVPAHQTAEA